MTRQEALAKIRKLYGSKAYASVGNTISSPERRAQALEDLRAVRAEREALEARYLAWLKAQPEHTAYMTERKRLGEAIRKVEGWPHYFKFSIGRSLGWANEITGSGDTWEEALAAAEKRGTRS